MVLFAGDPKTGRLEISNRETTQLPEMSEFFLKYLRWYPKEAWLESRMKVEH